MCVATSRTAPNRELVFEIDTSCFGSASKICRFQIVAENAPGIVRYLYYQATDEWSSVCYLASNAELSMTSAVNVANAIPVG